MPDEIILPDGKKIRYQYAKDNPVGPARRFRNEMLTGEFRWLDPLHLSAFRDHDAGLEQVFVYDGQGALERIRLAPFKGGGENRDTAGFGYMDALLAQGNRERMRQLLDGYGGSLDLFCGRDQVGSLRSLTDARGRLIKEIRYDSFGLRLHDSLPELFVPVGFAGGLVDPDTGFVRFGWRDYDPAVGRFTAPDPLGDTGGDHDVYEYCVDDPVSRVDPAGLADEPVKDDDSYGWIRKNIFWWTLPQGHPIHNAKTAQLTQIMSKELTQFATPFVELDREYPLPTTWTRFLVEKILSKDFNNAPRISDGWNKDGSRKK